MTTNADLQASVDLLIPAAARAAIHDAGWNPDTKSGERLFEWAMAQAADGRVPSTREVFDKGHEWNLPVETPAADPASVENRIAEARANGDYMTASKLQYAVDRVRNGQGPATASDTELVEMRAAREAAEQAQDEVRNAETEEERIAAQKRASAAWTKASRIQATVEARNRGAGRTDPESPPATQPTGGLSPAELALLEDNETPIKDLITNAREQGFYQVASTLQTRLEKKTQ